MANGGGLRETSAEAGCLAPRRFETRCCDTCAPRRDGCDRSGQSQVRFPQGRPWPAAETSEPSGLCLTRAVEEGPWAALTCAGRHSRKVAAIPTGLPCPGVSQGQGLGCCGDPTCCGSAEGVFLVSCAQAGSGPPTLGLYLWAAVFIGRFSVTTLPLDDRADPKPQLGEPHPPAFPLPGLLLSQVVMPDVPSPERSCRVTAEWGRTRALCHAGCVSLGERDLFLLTDFLFQKRFDLQKNC